MRKCCCLLTRQIRSRGESRSLSLLIQASIAAARVVKVSVSVNANALRPVVVLLAPIVLQQSRAARMQSIAAHGACGGVPTKVQNECKKPLVVRKAVTSYAHACFSTAPSDHGVVGCRSQPPRFPSRRVWDPSRLGKPRQTTSGAHNPLPKSQ